jgi:deoxyribose-phosphate aldolase
MRNPGAPFAPGWVAEVALDETAVLRRAVSLESGCAETGGRNLDCLLRAVRCLDLTTLSEQDTRERVLRLCEQARRPLPSPAPAQREGLHAAAVCVFDRFVPDASAALHGSGIGVAAVTGGFPYPSGSLVARARGVAGAVASGATEVDVVITREHIHALRWRELYDEVAALREASGRALLKTILGTGEIRTPTDVARASLVCFMAGADFVKTSTGHERVNATDLAGIAITNAIRRYHERVSARVGLKASGGIRRADQAVTWLRLVDTELGPDWAGPDHFRIGASSLLADIELQLRHHTA